jgi:hypothetical protein
MHIRLLKYGIRRLKRLLRVRRESLDAGVMAELDAVTSCLEQCLVESVEQDRQGRWLRKALSPVGSLVATLGLKALYDWLTRTS